MAQFFWTHSVEWLELVLRGCVRKYVKNGDHVVALDYYRQPLVQEGFLAVVISDLSDVPSMIVISLTLTVPIHFLLL